MPDALVLAGGRPDPTFAPGTLPKAFALLAGRPMVEFVLAALRAAPSVRRIALVGPLPLSPAIAAGVDVPVGMRGSLLENVAAGLDALGGEAPVLISAADIPLLRAGAVEAFLAAAAGGADIAYAIVPRADVLREFPGARKTFVRLRDGAFTGGSLMLVRPGGFHAARPQIERAIQARKRPWELARLFGLRTVAGFLTGGLTIADLEERAAALTGIRARAVICHDPAIALDVDRPETLAIVHRRLVDRSTVALHAAEDSTRP
jgi:GTP:adenosylcobinamide-phosphate guanylyltransferase